MWTTLATASTETPFAAPKAQAGLDQSERELVDRQRSPAIREWRKQMPPKYPRNTGQPRTPAAERELHTLAAGNTPTRVIGLKPGRSEDAVRTHAAQLGISLKPVNQSPYNRKQRL